MKFDIEACKERLKKRRLHPGSEKFYMTALEALQRDHTLFDELKPNEQKVLRWYLLLKKPLTLELCGKKLGVSRDRPRVILARAASKLRKSGGQIDIS